MPRPHAPSGPHPPPLWARTIMEGRARDAGLRVFHVSLRSAPLSLAPQPHMPFSLRTPLSICPP